MATDQAALFNKTESDRIKRCLAIRSDLTESGIYGENRRFSSGTSESAIEQATGLWRISPDPFWITQKESAFLQSLGNRLLAFYKASNRLYFESIHGEAPAWIADYLDQGKPAPVIEYGRMNRFKQAVPGIIRPDLIPTDEGMAATELDAIPGGIGLTAALEAAYKKQLQSKKEMIGLGDGMLTGFERMIRSLSPKTDPCLAIVVSEESRDYRPEMALLTRELNQRGLLTSLVNPQALSFTEEGLFVEIDGSLEQVDILYRFFELFDLKNIPKSELFLYAAKKKRVIMTPPPKAYLEEKSLFALFHHPALKRFWLRHLGEETTAVLRRLFPKTWIVDPQGVPPHAIIPDLTLEGEAVTDFRQLAQTTQKGRRFVIKPSGFSALAWGSRGVSVGHDLSEEEWRKGMNGALASFQTTPYVLQKFHKGKKFRMEYYDFDQEKLVTMSGRVRLSPYYFVEGKEARLGGVLATLCSLEKKLIHGMVDAVMAPCAVAIT